MKLKFTDTTSRRQGDTTSPVSTVTAELDGVPNGRLVVTRLVGYSPEKWFVSFYPLSKLRDVELESLDLEDAKVEAVKYVAKELKQLLSLLK